MGFCDGCGQELSGSVCGFCGQASTPVDAPIETQKKTSKFRWLRSDRPKRYLAEIVLISAVVLLSAFLIVPNFQADESTLLEEDGSLTQEKTDEPPVSESEPSPDFYDISRSADSEGKPSQGQYSFSQWLETWDYSFDEPSVEKDNSCRNSTCVRETLRITFAPMSDFSLHTIKGVIRNTSGQRLSPTQESFEIVEGDRDYIFEFSNESFVDLRQYPGNIFFQLEFFEFDVPNYRIRPENRILDLSESGEG